MNAEGPQASSAPAASERVATPVSPGEATQKRLSGLSAIVTAYNEEGSLETVVETLKDVLPTLAENFEIIIVDDGSRDATPRIANRLAEQDTGVRVIHHPFNVGFGGAQKSGFLHSRYEWITVIPGDNQFDPRDLARYLPFTEEADIIIGYRVNRRDSWMRRLNTRVFRLVIRSMFGVTLRDINWVKLFRKSMVDVLDLQFRGIGVDAEVVVKAARAGCRFAELEVGYRPRRTGVSTGDKPINVLITIVELMYLRWLVWRAR